MQLNIFFLELALKGPGHFLHPDDVIPRKQRHPPIDPDSAKKHRKQSAPKPEVYGYDVIPEPNEIDQPENANQASDSSSSKSRKD